MPSFEYKTFHFEEICQHLDSYFQPHNGSHTCHTSSILFTSTWFVFIFYLFFLFGRESELVSITVNSNCLSYSLSFNNSTVKCYTMSTVQSIEFENNRFKVCYSGQLLSGKVNFFLPADSHIKGKNSFHRHGIFNLVTTCIF